MTAAEFLEKFLDPGLSFVQSTLGAKPPVTDAVRVLMLAIAGQESGWQNIRQEGVGPNVDAGMGPWQMQRNTVADILSNLASEIMAIDVCRATKPVTSWTAAAVYDALLAQPNLSTAFARLDLWCDRLPLPAVGDEEGALTYYIRCWGPGAITKGGALAVKEKERWSGNYAEALAAVKGESV